MMTFLSRVLPQTTPAQGRVSTIQEEGKAPGRENEGRPSPSSTSLHATRTTTCTIESLSTQKENKLDSFRRQTAVCPQSPSFHTSPSYLFRSGKMNTRVLPLKHRPAKIIRNAQKPSAGKHNWGRGEVCRKATGSRGKGGGEGGSKDRYAPKQRVPPTIPLSLRAGFSAPSARTSTSFLSFFGFAKPKRHGTANLPKSISAFPSSSLRSNNTLFGCRMVRFLGIQALYDIRHTFGIPFFDFPAKFPPNPLDRERFS